MMDGMGMMVWGLLSFLIGLILVFLFTLAVVVAVKWIWGQKTPFVPWGSEGALDILKKRYAKGEIGKDEFERIKKDIE
jgi:putative membrane protein